MIKVSDSYHLPFSRNFAQEIERGGGECVALIERGAVKVMKIGHTNID